MRILFYLPVVTPWWFDNIIAPLIRHLASEAEMHVMVPPLWRGTGIEAEQLAGFIEYESIAWHILDGDDHPALRCSAAGCADLLDLVHAIDADYTLCRSADIETPARFPGSVKFVMEAGFPPFPSGDDYIVFRDHPFNHGLMPDLGLEARAGLAAAFDPAWEATRRRFSGFGADRAAMLERLGLQGDRAVIALPLEYEHEENFFAIHRRIRSNADLVPAVAEALGDDFLLAVTDHPLNLLYVDRTELLDSLARLDGRVALVEPTADRERPTFDLAAAGAGMIFENSKTISVPAFFGTPILRMSPWHSGEWLNASTEIGAFARAVRDGAAAAPNEDDARTWFAFHVANNIVKVGHPAVDGPLILSMLERPIDSGRWNAGLQRYADVYPELFQ